MSTPARIGPYHAGEKPEPLVHQFYAADGSTLSTPSGWTAVAEMRQWGQTAVALTASVNTTGLVTVNWPVAGLTVAADYDLEVWIGNGTNRYDSQRFQFQVAPSLAVPAI